MRGSVDDVLTCRWASACPSPCGRARVCGQQDCLQHHERLLSTKRNRDCPRFCGLLVRASGRHPVVSVSLVATSFLRGLTFQTDKSTVTTLHVSRTCRTIRPTLRRRRCSDQSSLSRARRCGAAVSFQLPPGEIPTTTLQPQIHLTCWKKNKNSCFVCARDNMDSEIQGARLLLFLFSRRLSSPRFLLYRLAASLRALLLSACVSQR